MIKSNIIDYLRRQFPEEVAEFEIAPWDFKVIGNMGIEEEPSIWVRLEAGKSLKYRRVFEFRLTPTDFKIVKET